MEMPSPILILGDRQLSQNNINGAKKKYNQYRWITFSASKNSHDEIRTAAGQGDFLGKSKVILIDDLPDRKDTRLFLLDLVKMSSHKVKFIIWDSTNAIAIDPKKRTFGKKWNDFIAEFKKNKEHKIVNNGDKFSDKEDKDCIAFIQDRFSKAKRKISAQNAQLLSDIVGRERGMLASEISKLLMTCPSIVTKEFLMDNAFPSSKEAVIYKFGNILDTGSYGKSVEMMHQFLNIGINENVLADIMVRKARWQLVAASYWKQGMSWPEVVKTMMQMGKYPSSIWHEHTMTYTEKKKLSEGLKTIEDRMQYIEKVCGIKKSSINRSKKTERAEVVPMEFMATLTTEFLRKNIISNHVNRYKEPELKHLVLDRCTKVYLFVLNKLKEIRYGENPIQDLQEMVSAITSKNI